MPADEVFFYHHFDYDDFFLFSFVKSNNQLKVD